MALCGAGVPAARAAELGRWAAQLARWPPPARLHESLELRLDERALGLHAVARRAYGAGDLVLREAALLRVPELPRAARAQLERRFGSRAPFLSPALAVEWHGVGEDVRRAALDLFWAHPSLDPARGTEWIADNLRACETLREVHAPLQQLWEAPDLMRFMHIVDLNIHRDDEVPGHADFSGLFVLGSKFSHSCAPNCSWSFNDEGCLQYHAIRPISPGDLFTFSYIGNGMNLMVSTIERRHRLGSLWFVCQCSRCGEPDLVRRMRCPKCGSPECVPEYAAEGNLGPEWAGERPLRDLIPDAASWSCRACGSTCAASVLPLREEEELSELVPRVMQGPPEGAGEDAAALAQLRARAAATLGTNHWTFALATFAWLQKCYVQLRAEALLAFSEADLRSACGAVAQWLRASAAQNAEQRCSALFLALRLARELGGGPRAWGYDPVEPLGAALGAVGGRLRAHGWRLSEAAVEGGEAPAAPGAAPRAAAPGSRPPPPPGARPFRARWRAA